MSFPMFFAMGVGYFVACKWDQWPAMKQYIAIQHKGENPEAFKEFVRDDIQQAGHIFRIVNDTAPNPRELTDGVLLLNPEDVYGPSEQNEHSHFDIFKMPTKCGRYVMPAAHDF